MSQAQGVIRPPEPDHPPHGFFQPFLQALDTFVRTITDRVGSGRARKGVQNLHGQADGSTRPFAGLS